MDDDRRAKLERLREAGHRPVPALLRGRSARRRRCTPRTASSRPGEETDAAYRVAGRLTGRREFGKAAFLDVTDRSGKIQVQARKDVLGDESFEQLTSLDLGDIIGVDGTAFKSRRGELTLRRHALDSCWPSRSLRRPTSSTGSRTPRPATAAASST